ncbi:MAG: 5-formyltetrahydrofolate cyclo-ligase [Brumimicrobium sp.]
MKKSFLREKYKLKRQELLEGELETCSLKIANNAISSFNFNNKLISIFLPIKRFKEIDTYPLISKLKASGAQVCTPVSDFNNLALKHIIFDNNSDVQINKWGIPEPQNGREVLPESIDFVFVPLLAVDVFGNRVGYGKGFYDRFLSICPRKTVFIGLHLFDIEKIIEDANSTDIKMHYIITPDKVFKSESE